MFTMEPLILLSIMYLPTAWAMKKLADRLMLMVRFQSSALMSSASSRATMPAQLTRMSIWPKAFTPASMTWAG